MAQRDFFVAVLSNQPQGGFITRQPTVDARVARDNFQGGDVSSFFPRGWDFQTGNRRRRGYDLQMRWDWR
jgi:hypothetical protein